MGGGVMKERIERILSEAETGGMTKGQRRGLVLPLLQKVQREFGYLPKEAVPELARFLGASESQVFGVATFYSQFRFSPPGENHITVCCGTACHVRGSAALLKELRRKLSIRAGETTPDGKFSLDTIACFGSCALAPVAVINGKVQGRMNRARLLTAVGKLASGDGKASEAAAGEAER
jgi:NADH-quinone oxidoreductase subunit E